MPIPSDDPRRSPSFERTGAVAASKARQRRSTPAAPTSESFAAEIARLNFAREKLLAEFAELPDQESRGWMHKRRAAALAARLRNVDKKIFAYRQFVFLFGDPI